jgi:hypothetical protein
MAKSPLAGRAGGSFAPPIDSAKLASYRSVISAAAPEHLKEGLLGLATMVEKFQETPASPISGTPHPSGTGVIVPLETAEVQRIWDYVPWDHELNALQSELDKLEAGDLRNASFHLLWFGKELAQDREPLTSDRL